MSVSPRTSFLLVQTVLFRSNEPRTGKVSGNKRGKSFGKFAVHMVVILVNIHATDCQRADVVVAKNH